MPIAGGCDFRRPQIVKVQLAHQAAGQAVHIRARFCPSSVRPSVSYCVMCLLRVDVRDDSGGLLRSIRLFTKVCSRHDTGLMINEA